MSFHPRSILFCFALSSASAFAAEDQLKETVQKYADTVRAINGDLDQLSAMDRKCMSQNVVYDPKDLSQHYKETARMMMGQRMQEMDQAILTLGQELAVGKQKLNETTARVTGARDSLEKLTGANALSTADADACTGGAAAQSQVLATAQTQVDKAKFSLSLDSDAHANRIPKVSAIITKFRTLVGQEVAKPEFTGLIKACMGPAYTTTMATMQRGLARINQLQSYANSIESSVSKMSDGLDAQAAGMKKLGDCKSAQAGAAKPKPDGAKPASTITDSRAPSSETQGKPAMPPSASLPPAQEASKAPQPAAPKDVDPTPPATPGSTAAGLIKSQGNYFTNSPSGVPNATDLSQCYADPCSPSQVRAYQSAINQYISSNHLPITPVAVDGVAGTQTANAWRAVMNTYNSGSANGDSYVAWGASSATRDGTVYYTFPPGKITSTNQLSNFFR